MKATKFVLCCMTIHHLLPRLPPDLGARVISLLDVIADSLPRTGKRHLLLCSRGTRRLGLFENHRRRDVFERGLVFPSEEDQDRIHRDLIYPIKRSPDLRTLLPLLDTLLEKYGVDSFVAGCTEMHVLAKHLASSGGGRYECVDPLTVVARRAAENRL